MYSGSEPETSQAGRPIQSLRSVFARAALGLGLPVALAALSGCGSVPASINPVTWWHDLQGGQIAEQRPPPPGATDPYPNISTVPDRPAPLDPNIRRAIDQGLVADRANAQHEAAAAPIPDPSSRTASPGLFGGATPPPPGTATPKLVASAPSAEVAQGPSATLAAATAPPAAAATAPPAPGQRTPPALPPGALADPASVPLGQMPEGSTAQMGPLPPLPTTPPAPADLPGANPPPPLSRPVPPVPAGAPQSPGSMAVPFASAAASLAPDGLAAVHGIAVTWSNAGAKAGIVITGYGDATSSDPAVQANALTVALLRAQAIGKALVAEGLPAGAMVTDAQAEGRGAAVRLVN